MENKNFLIANSQKITSKQIQIIGGKASGLHKLYNIGLNVPEWITITAVFFRNITESTDFLKKTLFEKSIDFSKKAKIIRERIKTLKIPPEYTSILENTWNIISKNGKYSVSVRSSAMDEDSKMLSFAGQMDSFLNVTTKDMFLIKVLECWSSLYTDRVVMYRQKNNLDPWNVNIAVIVQRMIEAEVSGVMFTVNTVNNKHNQVIISAGYGLGEGIVSGTVDTDNFITDRRGRLIKEEIAEKKQAIRYNSTSGTIYHTINKEIQNSKTLRLKQIKILVKIGIKIEKYYSMPMDIEFAIYKNKIYILQARPITKIFQKTGKDNILVWDNSNIVESYSGVTTPLTFTFIQKAYSNVYYQFCKVLGLDKRTIENNKDLFTNMIGLIYGRVYYNLINWYKLVALLPGYKYNKSFMEQMMGLQVIKEYIDIGEEDNFFKKYFVYLPRTINVGFNMIFILLTLKKRIKNFFKFFYYNYNTLINMDFDQLSTNELFDLTNFMEEKILKKWKEPILNDLKAMIFYGLLKNFTSKWKIDNTGSLQNDLLAGEGDIKSKKVVTELYNIANRIANSNELKVLMLKSSPEKALNLIQNDKKFEKIKESFEKYLKEYGVRSIEEMKLESIPIKDNPVFCIAVIKNYLNNSVPDPDEQHKKEINIRRNAEKILKRKLKYKPFKLGIYNWILKHTRGAIKDRENQRFCRSEAYSIIRDILKAIGRKWASLKIIENQDDIFFIEWNEIWAYLKGTSTCVNLSGLVKLRKLEFEKYKKIDPSDHIETTGEVYPDLKNYVLDKKIEKSRKLSGLGCCAGIVEKEVKVVLKPDPSIKLNNEIMVAKQTDPGWVILFPAISGLIVEKGSMLSHSAIVAREMGIPAVVGVKNAVKILKTGDRVRLDGSKGTIDIL